MSNNHYVVEYAKTGRASCKAKLCRKIIDKAALRIGKRFPSARFTEDGEATDWFHPHCMFETLSRAKKTTKKIEATSDLEGYGSLQPSDQKLIMDYIKAPPVKKAKDPNAPPSSPKPKKPKASSSSSSSKSKKNTSKVLKAWAVREKDGKRTELPVGGTFFGRGDDTGITDKRCSRSQLEVSVSLGNVSIRANGANPSILIRADGTKEVLDKGNEYDLNNGDSFCVLMDEYRYTVHVQRENDAKPAPAAASPAKKRAASDSEGDADEEVKSAPKLAKLPDSDEEDVGLPTCQYGPACFRKNPQHFKEFAHPWKKD